MKKTSKTRSLPKVGVELLPDGSLRIRIVGSPVPSFKNAKHLAINRRTGKRFLRTDDHVKAWMSHVGRAIASECSYVFRTNGVKMPIIASHASWTCLLPPDDNWRVVPHLEVRAELCRPGEEGAQIIITQLP